MGKDALKTVLQAAVVVGGVWLLVQWFQFTGDLAPAEAEPEAQERESLSPEAQARAACMLTLKEILHDPSSAEWGAWSDNFYGSWPAAEREDGRVEVAPRFRAANAFGARIMSEWRCVVALDEAGAQVISLDQL